MVVLQDTVTILCCGQCLRDGATTDSARVDSLDRQLRTTSVADDGTTWTHVACLSGHRFFVQADRGALDLGFTAPRSM